MQGDYFFFYTEANIVCILILLILLVNDRLHNTRQEKQIRFNWTVVAHFGYFISDICWAAVLSGNLPRTRLLVGLFNFTNLMMMHLLAFEWFLYMAASENMDFRKSVIYVLAGVLLAGAIMLALSLGVFGAINFLK